MKIPLIAFCVAVSAFCAAAQNITRVTTLVVHSARTNSAGAVLSHGNATNQIYLAAGEAARLSTFGHVTHGFDEANFAQFWFVRDEWYWNAERGAVVEGPAWFVIELTADANSSARMTLERFKVAKK